MVRVVQAYITSMVGSVDVVCQDQSLDDPLQDGKFSFFVSCEEGGGDFVRSTYRTLFSLTHSILEGERELV